jgi:integrase/recombinase XerD
VRTLKAFFSWLEHEEYVATNPMHYVPVPKSPMKIIHTFSTDHISRLLDVCKRSDSLGCRDLAIILLMLDTGFRVSEGYINISNGKGGKGRVVLLGSILQKMLWKYLNHHRPKPLTEKINRQFLASGGLTLARNGIWQMLQRYGKRASIDGVRCSPHTFRHTFVKNYLLNGGDIFSLQKILGHSSLASVRIYLNLFAGKDHVMPTFHHHKRMT